MNTVHTKCGFNNGWRVRAWSRETNIPSPLSNPKNAPSTGAGSSMRDDRREEEEQAAATSAVVSLGVYKERGDAERRYREYLGLASYAHVPCLGDGAHLKERRRPRS